MKQFIFLLIILFTSICFPQNYVEKQSLYHSNELQNAGFENNKLYWSISASSTAVIVSGSNALDGILSLGFTPTASGQTITSNLVDLKCTDLCQASVWYKTSEATNLPVLEVLNSSNSVVATKTLSTTASASQATITFSPISQAKVRVRASGSAVVTYLDKFKLGDREILNSADIVLSLGYTPASSNTVDINTNNIATVSSTMLRKDNNLSDVASATVARTNLGLGSLATKSTATLSSSDVSGTLPVTNGGTGFNSVTTGDTFFASGTSINKLPIGTAGKVLTVGSSLLPEWAASSGGGGDSGVNLITNNSFELDVTTGWTTSGVTVTRQAYTNGTSANSYYASMTATVSGAYFETSSITIPDDLRGNDLEFGGYHINSTGAWRADYFVSGTVVASQTLASATTWVQDPIAVAGVSSNQTTTKVRYTSLTSGTATLGIDKVYAGSKKSFTNGAIVGPWTDYIPTVSNLGTGSYTINFARWRRVGDSITLEFRITKDGSGGSGASAVAISSPSGIVAAASPSAYTGAQVAWTNASFTAEHAAINAGATSFNIFSENGASATGADWTAGSVWGGSVTFKVEGWQATGVSYDGRCNDDFSCTNDFSATITGTTLTSQSINGWLASCANPSTGNYNCTFKTGLFSVAPVCIAQGPGQGNGFSVTTVTTTTVTFQSWSTGSSALQAISSYSFKCERQASDFLAKKTIQGYLSNTVTTNSTTLKRQTEGSFTCSGSSAINSQDDNTFTSISNISSGVCSVNYQNWGSVAPRCYPNLITCSASGGSGCFLMDSGTPTTSTKSIKCFSDTGINCTSFVFEMNCSGVRQ